MSGLVPRKMGSTEIEPIDILHIIYYIQHLYIDIQHLYIDIQCQDSIVDVENTREKRIVKVVHRVSVYEDLMMILWKDPFSTVGYKKSPRSERFAYVFFSFRRRHFVWVMLNFFVSTRVDKISHL